jgi:uncharacterized protein (TIGR01319 family)
MRALLIDFGSTYTKVIAADLRHAEILGCAQAPTTIATDVGIGLKEALARLEKEHGVKGAAIEARFACSSAAGGLKMVAVGLVPSLTTEAAKRAALGAGAKVVGSYGFDLTKSAIAEIEAMSCDIIMLAGGTDGGNQRTILHNARMLAKSQICCPILVCGNSAVRDDIEEILSSAGKQTYATQNVLPSIDKVEVGPAQGVIRDIFINHITRAKGLDKIQAFVGRDILPTPKASLDAAYLLAKGAGGERGIGSLMVVEVGGATINVHSVESVKPVSQQTILRGLPEAEVKRTVEGDLGIRWNAQTICELVGAAAIEEYLGSAAIDPMAHTGYLAANTGHVPASDAERDFDVALARLAADVAVRRHAGTFRKEVSVIGEIEVQWGKNLLDVENVVGIGGIFKYGKEPARVLGAAKYDPARPESLKPLRPKLWLDKQYMMFGVGLLSQEHPEEALRIAKRYLEAVP